MLSLAVFLGNPGKKYSFNRHNAGRLLAEKLSCYDDLSWKKKFKGRFAQNLDQYFLIPETYMNLSGNSVNAACSFYNLPPEKIIVVHDELELPLGFISLKFAGGLGGHNGLRSIKESLGTVEFWRLRIGIGRPPGRDDDIARWVLEDFTDSEKETLDRVLEAGAELLLYAFSEEPEELLPEWKKKLIQ